MAASASASHDFLLSLQPHEHRWVTPTSGHADGSRAFEGTDRDRKIVEFHVAPFKDVPESAGIPHGTLFHDTHTDNNYTANVCVEVSIPVGHSLVGQTATLSNGRKVQFIPQQITSSAAILDPPMLKRSEPHPYIAFGPPATSMAALRTGADVTPRGYGVHSSEEEDITDTTARRGHGRRDAHEVAPKTPPQARHDQRDRSPPRAPQRGRRGRRGRRGGSKKTPPQDGRVPDHAWTRSPDAPVALAAPAAPAETPEEAYATRLALLASRVTKKE